MHQGDIRGAVLAGFGATSSEIDELLANNLIAADQCWTPPLGWPIPEELCVAAWKEYWNESQERGVFPTLHERLVQLHFPIRQGMSATDDYRAATRRGTPPASLPEATGLVVKQPGRLQLSLHATLAGRVPLLQTPERDDFVTLVQALAWRNEPAPVPASQGACLVVGLNNWDRIRQLRQAWNSANPLDAAGTGWPAHFQTIQQRKELYQDSLILLSEGNYSNVSAADLGMSDAAWREVSQVIRREHECAHYVTRRLLGRRHSALVDEILADYVGIVSACGRFEAGWLLRFLGLEAYPRFRDGGRLQIYQGERALSAGAFQVLQGLVHSAVLRVKELDEAFRGVPATKFSSAHLLLALSILTLEELASDQAAALFDAALRKLALPHEFSSRCSSAP
jgi:hypothetical protein